MRFAIQKDLVKHLESLPVGIIKRLMSLQICIGRNKYVSIFSCYAPTMKSSDKIKENFYFEVFNQLRSTSIHDKLLLGNFNACVHCNTSV